MNPMDSKKEFRSRVSVLLVGIVAAILIRPVLSALRQMLYPGLFVLGAVLIFSAFCLTGMRYVIRGNKLYCRIWFIPYGSVDIGTIRSVRRSYNPLSSPAASLKRLRISLWGRGDPFLLISPTREREFIETLKAANPDIQVDVAERKGLWRVWDWDI